MFGPQNASQVNLRLSEEVFCEDQIIIVQHHRTTELLQVGYE